MHDAFTRWLMFGKTVRYIPTHNDCPLLQPRWASQYIWAYWMRGYRRYSCVYEFIRVYLLPCVRPWFLFLLWCVCLFFLRYFLCKIWLGVSGKPIDRFSLADRLSVHNRSIGQGQLINQLLSVPIDLVVANRSGPVLYKIVSVDFKSNFLFLSC